MISLEKWLILTPLQKLLKNVGDLGKLIDAKGFKKLPQSGHTGLSEWKVRNCFRIELEIIYLNLGSFWSLQLQLCFGVLQTTVKQLYF